MIWGSADQINRLFDSVQLKFKSRTCKECRSRDTQTHVTNSFGETLVVLGCWNCGHARSIARLHIKE